MILEIVNYGHPVLRDKGRRVDKVTPELRKFAEDMIETMHERDGVGLAAQQVGRALQMTVIDVRAAKDRPSTMTVGGEPRDPNEMMPMVLLNPVVTKLGAEMIVAGEGCLSFPDINGDVERAARVRVEAQSLDGEPIAFECGGLLARVAQHEVDHLNGILFIDRMDAALRASLSGKLKRLQKETKESLGRRPLADAAK
jgi:peptide deformylase